MGYHRGEREIQERTGRSVEADRASRVIRTGLTEVLAAFVGLQRAVVIGSADSDSAMWASMVTGPPGFARATGPRSLSLTLDAARSPSAERPFPDEPFEIGLLFPDRRTRLRLRINGIARRTARGLAIDTVQVFTNCPGRLRRRNGPDLAPIASGPTSSSETLSSDQRRWISRADTFFIATASDTGAADASHRGGEPGFVEVVSPSELTWTECPGNSMFTTLGNLVLDSRAGMLFVEEDGGATLRLTGTARVRLTGEEPTVHFTIARVLGTGPSDGP
ncbi:pyridoxamine 5'-phosphate oxidase family protein [Streptomyces sp. NPDC006551]|uniref:pyridoxamine 5'-phosphate oxidase family protein n=1 Tax=Streptomyces sp. NPDC006551 TaxID=3157178 RepID=UPI0033B5DF7D